MAPQQSTAVTDALGFIESSHLEYPLGELLASFVHEAVSPDEAARYLQSCDRGLRELVDDWIYIVESCTYIVGWILGENHNSFFPSCLTSPRSDSYE